LINQTYPHADSKAKNSSSAFVYCSAQGPSAGKANKGTSVRSIQLLSDEFKALIQSLDVRTVAAQDVLYL
jgi:hypothetical protein